MSRLLTTRDLGKTILEIEVRGKRSVGALQGGFNELQPFESGALRRSCCEFEGSARQVGTDHHLDLYRLALSDIPKL